MKSIEIISIPITDQEASKAFYQKIGFQILAEAAFGDNRKWVQVGIPGTDTSITLVTWFDKMPPGSIQGLVVKTEAIEQDIEQIRLNGIEVAEPDDTPWGKFAYIKDPDGNGISLHQG